MRGNVNMETETIPNIALKPPPLNSDQLNYLIWRYLQEAGYGDAAVKLQRDWKVEPENLPFAKHIKGQALVSLVQKGLRYHHLSLTIDETGRPSKQSNPSAFFFGPESARPASPGPGKESFYRLPDSQRPVSPFSGSSTIPKRRETEFNGPLDSAQMSAKRSRKTTQTAGIDRNGNGVRKTSADAPTSMDIDHINGNVRSPSFGDNAHDENLANGVNADSRMDIDLDAATPGIGGIDSMQHEMAESFPPLVHTLTNGESVGIQVAPAKVANLGPSTNVISLPEDSHVIKSVWRPNDPSLLTVAGDRFCGTWRSAHANTYEDGSKLTYLELPGSSDATLVTAVAWEPNGDRLAVATYSGQAGQLHVFDGHELILIEDLPASQRAIASLKWLSSPIRLVGIAPYEDRASDEGSSTTILLWDFTDSQVSGSPSALPVPELLLDLDSTRVAGQEMVCTAGGHTVYCCHVNDELSVSNKWSSLPSEGVNWAFVRCKGGSDNDAILVVASADSPRIWLPTRDILRNDAHDASITGLELRPRAFHGGDSTSLADFATSSLDGTIKIWRLDSQNSIETVHRLSIAPTSPIMSLAFSPDGFCLAGASYGVAQIWNAEHGYNLMASWEGTNEEWRGTTLKDEDAMSAGGISSVNGDGGVLSADHSLAWETDSKKMAFGLGSQVAIINFQR